MYLMLTSIIEVYSLLVVMLLHKTLVKETLPVYAWLNHITRLRHQKQLHDYNLKPYHIRFDIINTIDL